MQSCPVCRKRPRNSACGTRVYVSAQCPICLEESNPVVTLPCGHVLCEADFVSLGGRLQSDASGSSDDNPDMHWRRARWSPDIDFIDGPVLDSDSDISYAESLESTETYPGSDEAPVALVDEYEGEQVEVSETEYYPESDEAPIALADEYEEETEELRSDCSESEGRIAQTDAYEDEEEHESEETEDYGFNDTALQAWQEYLHDETFLDACFPDQQVQGIDLEEDADYDSIDAQEEAYDEVGRREDDESTDTMYYEEDLDAPNDNEQSEEAPYEVVDVEPEEDSHSGLYSLDQSSLESVFSEDEETNEWTERDECFHMIAAPVESCSALGIGHSTDSGEDEEWSENEVEDGPDVVYGVYN